MNRRKGHDNASEDINWVTEISFMPIGRYRRKTSHVCARGCEMGNTNQFYTWQYRRKRHVCARGRGIGQRIIVLCRKV